MDSLANQIYEFKMLMVRYMPFYGEVLLRVPIVPDDSVSIACTDGRRICYNPRAFKRFSKGARNYILMHEVLHIIFRHPSRIGERRRDVWNLAADLAVNCHVDLIMRRMPERSVPLERPEAGFFTDRLTGSTENLYELLLEKNKELLKKSSKKEVSVLVMPNFGEKECKVDNDLLPADDISEGILPSELTKLMKDAITRGSCSTLSMCHELLTLADIKTAKKKDWRKLLRSFLIEHVNDETSYATPERKYIHMDLLVPGYCLSSEGLEEVWAFVDTSGSISEEEMKNFLVQLYCIVRDFRCRLNLCYWDTSVSDVYLNLRSKEEVLKSVSHHSGGTDINCVYRWLREKHVKPGLMLIMTDGYFGALHEGDFMPNLKKKTILVISNDSQKDDYRRIGTTVRL